MYKYRYQADNCHSLFLFLISIILSLISISIFRNIRQAIVNLSLSFSLLYSHLVLSSIRIYIYYVQISILGGQLSLSLSVSLFYLLLSFSHFSLLYYLCMNTDIRKTIGTLFNSLSLCLSISVSLLLYVNNSLRLCPSFYMSVCFLLSLFGQPIFIISVWDTPIGKSKVAPCNIKFRN